MKFSFFNFTDTVRFKTDKSLDNALQALTVATTRQNPMIMIGSLVDKQSLVGRVSKDEVVLYWIRPLFGNVYKPVFYGKFVKDGESTALEGIFTMSPFSKLFHVVFFTVAGIMEFMMVLIFLGDPSQRGNPLDLLIVPAFFAIFLFVKRISRIDIPRITEAVNRAL
jgi:hypothetical protein